MKKLDTSVEQPSLREAMEFVFEKLIPVPREVLFQFHECPSCLAHLHQGWSKVRLLKHEKRLRVGGETWVEQTVAGFLPVVLGFRHHLLEPPCRFGEELIHGPFSRFLHVHEFEERGLHTIARDIVNVDWPWQYGGSFALRLLVEDQIRRLFQARGEAMVRLAEDGTIAALAARNNRPD